MGRLGVKQGVERLNPLRTDRLFTSQYFAVRISDILRAALFLPPYLHPLEVLVRAEMFSVLDIFLKCADIGLSKLLHCCGSRPLQFLAGPISFFLRLL